MSKIRVALLAGPTATIQNTPPLVTSTRRAPARASRPCWPATAARSLSIRCGPSV
jgi:hypothetical protein